LPFKFLHKIDKDRYVMPNIKQFSSVYNTATITKQCCVE